MYSKVKKEFDIWQIEYQVDVHMDKKTWIHRGPIVPLYILPKSARELELVVRLLLDYSIQFKIVGHTSNIYMLDTYVIGAIISTIKLNRIRFNQNLVVCDAGVNISNLSKSCVEMGYKGFDGLVGLPGTIGASIVNNSGCFNCYPSQLLIKATVLEIDENGNLTKMNVSRSFFNFSHRSSSIKRGEKKCIILDVSLKLEHASDDISLKKQVQDNILWRNNTQEGKAFNLGSIYSSRKPKPLNIFSLGIMKAPLVFLYKCVSYLFEDSQWFKSRSVKYILRLYGYSDIIKYVSSKNLNCFLWLDENADNAFERYQQFMCTRYELGDMEIEVLK